MSYRMVKKIAENFNRLSRVHQRYRRQTDRQTTDGIAMASSEREREFTSAKNLKRARSFVRYCGQGSSLLWTPALRPYVGPMR